MKPSDDYISLTEASEYAHVTRQAIYLALKKRGLVAQKYKGRWYLTKKDIDDYRLTKYDRSKTNNIKIEEGEFTIKQASKILSLPQREGGTGVRVSTQKLYYLIRTGQIKSFKKGAALVLMKDELLNFARILQESSEKQLMFI